MMASRDYGSTINFNVHKQRPLGEPWGTWSIVQDSRKRLETNEEANAPQTRFITKVSESRCGFGSKQCACLVVLAETSDFHVQRLASSGAFSQVEIPYIRDQSRRSDIALILARDRYDGRTTGSAVFRQVAGPERITNRRDESDGVAWLEIPHLVVLISLWRSDHSMLSIYIHSPY